MSSEIKHSVVVTCSNGDFNTSFTANDTIDQSAVGANQGVLLLSTTGSVDVPFGSVTTGGVVCLRNLDGTASISWGLDDSGNIRTIGKLKPGEPAFFRLSPGAQLMAKASSAPAKLHFIVLSD